MHDTYAIHTWITMRIHTLTASAVFLFLAFLSQGCSGEQCDNCDGTIQYCQVQQGSHFVQNGNPNPLGEPSTASCQQLPEHCTQNLTCECITCVGFDSDSEPPGCGARGGTCTEQDGLLTITFPTE